jgi:hypothetical protein
MRRTTVQTLCAFLVVGGHFGILLTILLSPTLLQLRWSEAISLIGVITPLFAGFTTAICKYYAQHSGIADRSSKKVSVPFAMLSIGPPAILSFLLLTMFLVYSLNQPPFNSIDDLRLTFASFETLFGVYIGYMLEGLFGDS